MTARDQAVAPAVNAVSAVPAVPAVPVVNVPLPLAKSVIVHSIDGRPFVAEAPETYRARIERSRHETLLRGNFHVPSIAAPAAHSLEKYQTPIRNQQDRGSCWAFAGVAAMEAAYRRKYGFGPDLDLSEQYVFHMGKTVELYPDYLTNLAVAHENNTSFTGSQGGSDILHDLCWIAVPEERFCPYLTHAEQEAIRLATPDAGSLAWTSTQEEFDAFEFSERNVPTIARWNARFQVGSYSAVPSTDPETLEGIIAAGHEIAVDFDLKWKYDAARNVLDYDPAAPGAGHVMLLIGYDRREKIFLTKNSWGEPAYLRLTYDFVRNCAGAGHYITDVLDPTRPPQKKAFWLGNWNLDHDGWRGRLVIRRFLDHRGSDPNAPTKIGNYYRDGERHDVNGYFVQDGQGLVFWVAPGTERVPPGTLAGQRFDSYLFSSDPANGAGKAIWNSTNYGAMLSRAPIPPSAAARPFAKEMWLGSWRMTHDGWRGRLTINALHPVPTPIGPLPRIDATYRRDDGTMLPVTGTVNAITPHLSTLNIRFAPDNNQRFDLMHHTHERDLFSGLTLWNGQSFGVQGFRE